MTGIIRSITTVPAHAFFAIFSGYYLSLAKQSQISGNNQRKYWFYSLLIPFLLHGFYDFCLLMQNMVLFSIYLIFIVALYSISIYQVKKMEAIDGPFLKRKINFCSNCGYKMKGKYCSNCGRKIEEDS